MTSNFNKEDKAATASQALSNEDTKPLTVESIRQQFFKCDQASNMCEKTLSATICRKDVETDEPLPAPTVALISLASEKDADAKIKEILARNQEKEKQPPVEPQCEFDTGDYCDYDTLTGSPTLNENYFIKGEWNYKRINNECAQCKYSIYTKDYIKSVRHLLDEKCVKAFFEGITRECSYELNDSNKTDVRNVWEIIVETCEKEQWFHDCFQQCIDRVLDMKKHNMWILKFLFKSGMKISPAKYEAERAKSNCSEAVLNLLKRLVDYSQEQIPEQKLVQSCEPSQPNSAATVKLNVSWKTGSFNTDITNGHTFLKEVNGQYEINVQL